MAPLATALRGLGVKQLQVMMLSALFLMMGIFQLGVAQEGSWVVIALAGNLRSVLMEGF